MIPKIIWTYWDKPELPIYIQDCINTWKIHCKNNWSINILNRNTIKLFLKEDYDYPKNIFTECPQHQSDMFGAALLNHYGGIWMDANIIMTAPIDFVLEKDWFGYYDSHDNPEVFFYATYQNNPAIYQIHSLFFKIFSIKKYNRENILKEEYNISDSYLYPQKLVNYLMQSNLEIKNIIVNNSLNQWETIYTLIVLLNQNYKVTSKSQVFDKLITEETCIPDIIYNHPLIKLQGSAQQNKYKINKKSWWWKLTHVK